MRLAFIVSCSSATQVGNKLDLVEASPQLRQVPQSKAKEFADNLDIPFLEVSAKVCRAHLRHPPPLRLSATGVCADRRLHRHGLPEDSI